MLNADGLQYRSVNTRLHSHPETNTKTACFQCQNQLVFSAKINCFNGWNHAFCVPKCGLLQHKTPHFAFHSRTESHPEGLNSLSVNTLTKTSNFRRFSYKKYVTAAGAALPGASNVHAFSFFLTSLASQWTPTPPVIDNSHATPWGSTYIKNISH